jgi:large repetitive protein
LATGTNPTTATAKGMIIDTTFTVTATNATGASTKTAKVTVNAATGVAPKILSSNPANGAPGVAFANNTITVIFDKAMDLATTKAALTMTGGTAPNLVLSADLKTATITFTAPAEPAPTAAGASNTIGYSFAGTAKSSDGGTLAAVTQNYTTKKLVLLSIPATAGAAATSLSGSVIFTGGTGSFTSVPPCATPCPRNYYDAEIRAGDNDATVNGEVALANRAYKGFVGFNITTVPALTAANLVSAKITMTQLAPVGAPYSIPGNVLKLQAITSADLATKLAVVGANSVDANKYAFYTAPFSATFDLSTGFVAASPTATATVTSALLADVTNRVAYGNKSLYRLIFPSTAPNPDDVDDQAPGKSDGDNGEDLAVFNNTSDLPKLEIVYTQ